MICSLAYIIKLEDINYTKEYDKIIAAQANDPSWVSNLLHMGSPCSKLGTACSQNLGLFQLEENDHRK